MTRSALRAGFGVAASLVAAAALAGAYACASFDESPSAADSGADGSATGNDAALDGAVIDATVADGAGLDSAPADGGARTCTVLFDESFASGFGVFGTPAVGPAGASIGVDGGMLVARVVPIDAYAQVQVIVAKAKLPKKGTLDFEFVVSDFAQLPAGWEYAKIGCTAMFRSPDLTQDTAIFATQALNLRLVSKVNIDGGVTSAGVDTLASMPGVPTATRFVIHMRLDNAIGATLDIADAATSAEIVDAALPPDPDLRIKCGIDDATGAADAGPWTQSIDYVRLVACDTL